MRQQQQCAEQQQCGDGVSQVAQHQPTLTRIGDPVEVELREAQHHGAQIGERHTAQATRYGCRIGIKHKQREREHLQRAQLRRQQHAGKAGKRSADGPAGHADAIGATTVEHEQRTVVDRGAHRDAQAGAVEQHIQRAGDDDRQQHTNDLVVIHGLAEHLHVGLAEELLGHQRAVAVAEPDPGCGAVDAEQYGHGRDQSGDLARATQAAHHQHLKR